MSTSLATQRYARRLFLELRALNLELQVETDAGAPAGHTVKLVGTKSLTPRHDESLERRVDAVAPELVERLERRGACSGIPRRCLLQVGTLPSCLGGVQAGTGAKRGHGCRRLLRLLG